MWGKYLPKPWNIYLTILKNAWKRLKSNISTIQGDFSEIKTYNKYNK